MIVIRLLTHAETRVRYERSSSVGGTLTWFPVTGKVEGEEMFHAITRQRIRMMEQK